MFLGDIYLGKKILAGDVFGERPESGGWNVSALDEETDAFETRKYVSFTPAADGKQALRSIRTAAVTCFATATASRPVRRADIGNCR